jgi:7,8-dihydro-6-hydroxymethylpterin-pyrophosphokinase
VRDAYVGFGSNIDPAANIRRALEALARRCEIAGVSTVYRSAALDRPADAEFSRQIKELFHGPRED